MKTNFSTLKSAGKSLVGFGQLFKTALILMLLILIKKESMGQTATGRFMSYDFSAATGNITSWPVFFGNTTYLDTAGIRITEGPGLSAGASAFNTAITAQGVNSTTEGAAVQAGDYFEITVTPKAGFEFRLDTLILRWQFQTATTNMSFALRSSRDNFRRTIATATQSSGTAYSNQVTNLIATNSPLYSSTSITIRIYVWGAGNQTRDFRITDGSATVNHDIDLRGRVTTARPLIQAFDFSASAGTQTSNRAYALDATYIDTSGVLITRGPGFTTSTAAAGSFSASPANQTTLANAVTANTYVQFTVKPKFGYEYSLDRILIRYFWNTGSPTGYGLRSSRDNYASNIVTGTITGNGNFATTLSSSYASQFIPLTTPLTTDSSITYRLYIFGAAAAGNDIRFTDSTVNNSFNYDIALYGTMTTSAIPKVTLSAPGSVTTCLGGGISLKTSAVAGTAPYTVWLKDNLGNQRVHTQALADSTFTIFPQSNRTYTLDSVKDVNGNKANSLSGTVTVTVTSSPVSRDTAVRGRTLNHLDGFTLTYADSTGTLCRSYATITDAAGGTNPGSTRVTATVLNAIPINNSSRYFISRHVRVQPTTNGNATVTLFFTQAEFTAFNTAALYHQKLPANPTDTVGVRSRILVRRTQSSIETASMTSFTPTAVTWNATNSQWEVTINVNDGVLGGFYYVSPPFNTSKSVGTISHTAVTPVAGNTTASVTVDWPDVAGVGTMQYRFRFRPVGSSVWNVSTITGSQRTMNNLPFNTSYELQIRVFESGLGQYVQGEYSNTYTFTTPLEPNKLPNCGLPTNISATATSPASAFLSWTSPNFRQNVLVEIRALGTLDWGGTSTVFDTISLTYLTPGTTYQYRLRTTCLAGYTANGVSNYTTIGTFTTPNVAACGTVASTNTVSTTTNTATISWTPVTYATSYQVQMRLKNTANWGGTTTAQTNVSFDNLSPSSVYEYQVRALCNGVPVVTSNNIGSFSATGEFATAAAPIVPACLPPTNLTATPTATSITVSWDSAAYGPQYFVNIKQASAASWGGSTVTGFTRTYNNLLPSTLYYVRVRTTCTPGATSTPFSVFTDTVFVTTTAMANKAITGTDQPSLWQVYPNPTRENLHVDFNSQSEEPVKVEVRDMTGRLIETVRYTPMIGSNTLDINLQSAADGLYLIHIFQGQTLQFMNKVQKTH